VKGKKRGGLVAKRKRPPRRSNRERCRGGRELQKKKLVVPQGRKRKKNLLSRKEYVENVLVETTEEYGHLDKMVGEPYREIPGKGEDRTVPPGSAGKAIRRGLEKRTRTRGEKKTATTCKRKGVRKRGRGNKSPWQKGRGVKTLVERKRPNGMKRSVYLLEKGGEWGLRKRDGKFMTKAPSEGKK